jgi:alanine-glyoxylate transaminase/serine-glyoxylate transaminase/serine-pyruvate transaminase
MHQSGRHFLQTPGPTNTALPVLAALSGPTINHRGPEFRTLAFDVLAGIKRIFKTDEPVIIYPASGTGAWEAALVNVLSPGECVLMFETGWFASLWRKLAERWGIEAEALAGDWRSGVDATRIEARLADDHQHAIKAVCVVHNETSTGVASDIRAVRRALDNARHPALLLVDTISSLASMDYRHDEWGVDVAIGGSQKGLMLPPGLSFNAISKKALAAAAKARLPRSYWDWEEMISANRAGFFPYTPATHLLAGLRVAIAMLETEGLDTVFARHARAAGATRAAVRHWGFETQCAVESRHSASLTAVRLPDGHSADALRAQILAQSNLSLGNGLGHLADRVFRIGHLGDFNDTALVGVLGAIEMGLVAANIPHRSGGTQAAMRLLTGSAEGGALAAE